jgi:cysteinyl-tRNA synthetase
VTSDGSVYFRLSSYANYGKLTGIDVRQLATQHKTSAGQTNLADEYDRDAVHDFALWKAHKAEDGEVYWDSPWGTGRPGWHIECSAMATKYLGETIDIHGGGIDLCFPHHENEIAQTECVTGKPFVRHWFHGEHLRVEGQKMSKSLGNLFTLADLQQRGYGAETIRYALISGHYRQILNFTLAGLDAAQSAFRKLRTKITAGMKEHAEDFSLKNITFHHFSGAIEALKNDLNVPKCLGEIFSILHRPLAYDRQLMEEFYGLSFILGLEKFIFHPEQEEKSYEIPENISHLALRRWEARRSKNFTEADHLRQILLESGWNVIDYGDHYGLEKMEKPKNEMQ